MAHSTSLRPTGSVIVLSTLAASSGRLLFTSSSAWLIADRSSGEVVELAAIAKAGPRRTGAGGAATLEGRSGMVDGVNAGAVRGTSVPAWLITPDGRIDEVAVAGRVGTATGAAAGAPVVACFLGAFSDLRLVSALRAASADFSADVESLSAEVCAVAFPGLPVVSALWASRDLSE